MLHTPQGGESLSTRRPRAVVYCRSYFRDPEQVTYHINECRVLAARRCVDITGYYLELGYSPNWGLEYRPQLRAALESLETGGFFLTSDPESVGTSMEVFLAVHDVVREKGCTFLTPLGTFLDDPSLNLIRALRAIRGE